jgi:hypothetical protein
LNKQVQNLGFAEEQDSLIEQIEASFVVEPSTAKGLQRLIEQPESLASVYPTQWSTREELAEIGHKADAWLAANKAYISSLPVGSVVIINMTNGQHTTAPTEDAAEAAFRTKYGDRKIAFVHRVGKPITVGSGWWALNTDQ